MCQTKLIEIKTLYIKPKHHNAILRTFEYAIDRFGIWILAKIQHTNTTTHIIESYCIGGCLISFGGTMDR